MEPINEKERLRQMSNLLNTPQKRVPFWLAFLSATSMLMISVIIIGVWIGLVIRVTQAVIAL